MDAVYPLLVVGTAASHVVVINLVKPTKIFRVRCFHYDLPFIINNFVPDIPNGATANYLAVKMADADGGMFPSGQWLGHGRYRRTPSHSVSKVHDIYLPNPTISLDMWMNKTKGAYHSNIQAKLRDN